MTVALGKCGARGEKENCLGATLSTTNPTRTKQSKEVRSTKNTWNSILLAHCTCLNKEMRRVHRVFNNVLALRHQDVINYGK